MLVLEHIRPGLGGDILTVYLVSDAIDSIILDICSVYYSSDDTESAEVSVLKLLHYLPILFSINCLIGLVLLG